MHLPFVIANLCNVTLYMAFAWLPELPQIIYKALSRKICLYEASLIIHAIFQFSKTPHLLETLAASILEDTFEAEEGFALKGCLIRGRAYTLLAPIIVGRIGSFKKTLNVKKWW